MPGDGSHGKRVQRLEVLPVQPDGTFCEGVSQPGDSEDAGGNRRPSERRPGAAAADEQSGAVLQLRRVRPQHQAVSVPDLQKVRRPGPLRQRVHEPAADEHDHELGVDRAPLLQHRLRTRIHVGRHGTAAAAAATATVSQAPAAASVLPTQ